jgi:hypothetical protein
MESRAPALLVGARVNYSRIAGLIPHDKDNAGVLNRHPVHSTVTDFETPAYRIAPK